VRVCSPVPAAPDLPIEMSLGQLLPVHPVALLETDHLGALLGQPFRDHSTGAAGAHDHDVRRLRAHLTNLLVTSRQRLNTVQEALVEGFHAATACGGDCVPTEVSLESCQHDGMRIVGLVREVANHVEGTASVLELEGADCSRAVAQVCRGKATTAGATHQC